MMIQQENKTGKWIALAISLPLSAFTIWRAWDIMTKILPADQALAAVFGIAALDGGMVGWIFAYMKAQSSDQRRVAGIAAFCDFVGVGLVTFVDLMQNGVAKGLVQAPANLFMAAIILISVAVILNVGFGWLYVLGDPKKKQEIRDQKAHDKINDLADAHIELNAEMYAPQFAQVKVTQWLRQAQLIHNVGQIPLPQVVDSQMALPQPQAQPPMQSMQHAQTAQQQGQKGVFGRIIDAAKGTPAAPPPAIDYDQLAKHLSPYLSPMQQPVDPSTGQLSDPLALPSLQTTPATGAANGNGNH